MTAKANWVVDIKGRPDHTFEITVLRYDNTHGKRSYGWIHEDMKRFISGSGGPCGYTVSTPVFNALVLIAHMEADRLNKLEEQNG